MPLPLLAAGQTPGQSLRHQLLVNGVLVVGVLVILLGFLGYVGAAPDTRPSLPIVVIMIFSCIAFLRIAWWFSTRSPGIQSADAASAEDIAVDRKLSKRSVSTVASSSAGSTIIYHVPSNSLERVVGGEDLEQAFPNAARN
jgi:hypothetical protein